MMTNVQRATITEKKEDLSNYAIQLDGYGKSKHPTRFMVKLDGYTNRWRRVYSMCYSNSGSVYCSIKGSVVFFENGEVLA